MAWIEYHAELRDHWKIQRLADAQNIAYPHALGMVSCLWLWAVNNAPTGDVSKFNDVELCRAARSTSVFEIKKTLTECELLDQQGRINDWKKHGLKYLQSAKLRIKKHRELKRYGNATVTPTLPNPTIPNQTQPEERNKTAFPIRRGRAKFEVVKPKEPTEIPAHSQFVEGFKATYEAMSGQPFKSDKLHFITAASLVKAHGLEAVVEKAKILGFMCKEKSAWFTKAGWADFSIATLSSKWNSIIPQAAISQDQEFLQELKKREAERERTNINMG